MKLLFRWLENKGIPLEFVKQIPAVKGVVSSLDMPVGSVWPISNILDLKNKIESQGLSFEVVESVKIHETIKMGDPHRDFYINNFCETIKNLGNCGIKVVCYDFMPIFDWFRTSESYCLDDKSFTLAYDDSIVEQLDPISETIPMSDWEVDYASDELRIFFTSYEKLDENDMFENLKYFLHRVIPVAEKYDVKLAIHPDDPCWKIFDLPRIVKNEDDIDRILKFVDSPYNAITLCSGSLGCDEKNNVASLVKKYGSMDRLAFGHIRNVKLLGNKKFYESSHYSESGSLDIPSIVENYIAYAPNAYIRPDHGRVIWNESIKGGYGLYDRALGIMYIAGIIDGIRN